MNKKVLIMCTGNSCRSIIAEALINKYIDGVDAYSCGVKPSGRVHESAKKILQKYDAWDEKYSSKHLDELLHVEFNLVVTVCGNANETCPTFPKKTKVIHVGFVDPDGLDYVAFEKTYKDIKEILLSRVKEELNVAK